jgi:phosphoglycolate phosphatase
VHAKERAEMSFTSVIFDFDYTLAESSRGVIDCVNSALRKLELAEAAEDDIRRTIGASLRETFRLLTSGRRQSEAEEFARLFALRADEIMLCNTVLLDSAKPSIKRLLNSGMRLAVVSSKFRYRIEAFLRRECQ